MSYNPKVYVFYKKRISNLKKRKIHYKKNNNINIKKKLENKNDKDKDKDFFLKKKKNVLFFQN